MSEQERIKALEISLENAVEVLRKLIPHVPIHAIHSYAKVVTMIELVLNDKSENSASHQASLTHTNCSCPLCVPEKYAINALQKENNAKG